MYKIIEMYREDLKNGLTNEKIGYKIGLTKEYICEIMNGRPCKKTTAYCLVKLRNPDFEIEDFFTRVEE